jgi:hypothetical protein
MNLIRLIAFASLLVALAVSTGCGGADVPTGTYEGTIAEVNADEREIYVETADHGTLELYFEDDTQLTQGGASVDFARLVEGAKVRVTVENVDGRLMPRKVELIGLSLPR